MTSGELEALARQLTLPAPDLSGPVSGSGTLYLGATEIADVTEIELNVARSAIGGVVQEPRSMAIGGFLDPVSFSASAIAARRGQHIRDGSIRALQALGVSTDNAADRLRDFGSSLSNLNPQVDSTYAYLQRMVEEQMRSTLSGNVRLNIDSATIEMGQLQLGYTDSVLAVCLTFQSYSRKSLMRSQRLLSLKRNVK